MTASAEKILTTHSAKEWLKNFQEIDLPIAKFFLRNLHFISHSSMERGLKKLILDLASSQGPIGLFAVREIGKSEKYFPESTSRGEADDELDYNELRPSRTEPGAEVGSEGRIANLIRNLTRQHSSHFIDHPGIAEMRAKRCAKILLVDDMLSTSGRLARFIEHIQTSEKKIRSWCSLGLSLIHI